MFTREVLFVDRAEAGRWLAERLVHLAAERPVVLALPRGGVPVGFEIANALEAPLDLVLVRKIGAPFQPELAVGAVVDGSRAETVVNEEIVRELQIPQSYVAEESARQLAEIERRREFYLAGRTRAPVDGRTAIVVDDGIATGATMQAALRATRRARPKRLVLAAPVAPPETIERLRPEVDEVVCLATPRWFAAIGSFYRDFRQVSDDEVVELLQRARAEVAGSAAEPGPAPTTGS
jgi:putative phosphoribosyl transferase